MNRNFSLVYITLFALSLLALGMALTYSNYEKFKEFTREETERQLMGQKRAVQERLEAKQVELEFLSYNPYITNSLMDVKPPEARRKIRNYLFRIKKKLGVQTIFLLDDQGNCILSTNEQFEGKHYGLSPYFRQALKKETGAFVSLGITGEKPVLYLSRRVGGNPGRNGVLVAELDPRSLFNSDELLSGQGISLWGAAENGILFNAGRNDFCSFENKEPEQLRTILGAKQLQWCRHTLGFPEGTWLELKKRGKLRIKNADVSYDVEYSPIIPGAFSLVSVIPSDFKCLEISIIRRVFLMTNGAFIFALVPMVIGVFFFWRQYEALLLERQEKSKTQYRYRAILQGNKDGFVVMSPGDLTIEECNNMLEDMLEINGEDESITGRSFYELMAPEDRERFQGRVSADAHDNFEQNARLVDAHGRNVPVMIEFNRHKSDNSAISFCYAFIQDMRKGLKDARKIRLLETASEQSGSSIIITDRDGAIQYVNPAFTRVTGYSAQEAIGQNPRILKSDRHDKAFYEKMWSTITSGSVWHARVCNRTRDGKLFWEDATIAPVQDETGEITHFIAIKNDVTELVELEEKLNQKVKELEGIMEHAGIAIALIQNRTFLAVNEPLARTLNLSKEELIGKSTRILLQEDYESFGKIFYPSLMKGESVSYQIERLMPNGEKRWFQITATAINPGPIEEMKTVWIGNDITQLKHLQLELEEQKIKAEKANRAKSAFLANMSHEIRTPLNGITGMLSLLESTCLNEQQREYVRIAQSSAEALLFIINDILDISKIEAGRMEFDSVDFSLSCLVEDFSKSFSALAEKKGIKYVVNLAEDVPCYLKGDPGRLRQILINLTGNALKFTERGKIELTVELVRDLGDEVILRFSVQDTGIGIPSDKIDLLFKKFSQVDVNISRKFGGTGLGLAISRKLAELMGGEIGVESQEGKGATFWFTVKLPRGANRKEPDTAHGTEKATIEGKGLKLGGRVLVVEDNPVNQKVITGFLRKIGLRADIVNNGKEAVEVLEMIPYDLVLMDVQMPVMDGFAATRAIRDPDSRVLNRQIPIIALTAYAFRDEISMCNNAGMNDYLAKPIEPHKLTEVLVKWLPKPPAESTEDQDTAQNSARADMPEEGDGPVFDRNEFLERTLNDLELGRQVLEMFVETGSKLLSDLNAAIQSKNDTETMHLAHSFKGASGNVSAPRLADVASILEKTAREGRLDNVAEQFEKLKREFERFMEEEHVENILG